MSNNSTRKALWRSWRSEAARHFNISVRAIDSRWQKAEPELIEWIREELKARKQRQDEAKINKQKLLSGEIDDILKNL